MPFIAVTGSYCSGKSTVIEIFRQLGAVIYDIDKETAKFYRKSSPLYRELIRIFGETILDKRGDILKEKVAEIVFSSKEKLSSLNELTHPRLIEALEKFLKTKNRESMVVVEVPLLFESGLQRMFDYSILVVSPRLLSLHRAKRGRKIREEDFRRRLSFQLPEKRKKKLADFVIKNDGTKNDLKRKVVRIWKKIVHHQN